MIEKIQIYIRGENKTYIYINDEILYFEDQEIQYALESLKEEYEFGQKRVNAEIILHFSYFHIENPDEAKQKNTGIMKKWHMDYRKDRFLRIYLEKSRILKWKRILRKHGLEISNIKIDFDAIYNYCKEDDCEILQIGEAESVRLVIEDGYIPELEKLELKIEDIDDIENFDFSDMKVFGVDEESIRAIFLGGQMYENPNFVKQEFSLEGLKNIEMKNILVFLLLLLSYFVFGNFIPVEKTRKENEKIKESTKKLEESYLKEKSEKLPDYSKELALLREIDGSLTRKEYYSKIKFLVESSEIGIDYIKIGYENKKWNIEGEILNFDNFEKFENKIQKKYGNTELGYIKDNDTATIFEYSILE